MKKNIFKLVGLILLLFTATISYNQLYKTTQFPVKKISKTIKPTEFQEGDIIFQTSNSMQSKAIQIATQSKYSHVGIIMTYDGELVVLEAVQPIKITPIKVWIRQGVGSFYSLKRLKNRGAILTGNAIKKMRVKGKSWIGKNYDIAFDWSDKKLYCSELVWKLYKEGCEIEIGELKKLKDYDLSHPVVKQAMEQRYGKQIPWEEKMISPQAIFESNLLETVK
ncbi:MAG: YiiX family permuted papain-like enzyme [Flavobacteriales bacterium]